MAAELEINKISWGDWISANTEFEQIKYRLLDKPSDGISAWARTTAGIAAFLIFLQFLTGILMAFQYVPSAENAYTTVAYIEQAVSAGSWIRSLHYHSSVLLPVVLILHLAQMIFRNAFGRIFASWMFALSLLALVLAAGATGYALPWDARALNGVNVAVSLAGNAPLIGAGFKNWLQNGGTISTLTLSRFYGLHVFIVPFLILFSIAARFFFLGGKKENFDFEEYKNWARKQFIRNTIAVGIVFLGLAIFSQKYPAPFGPTAADAGSFLPRPGPQFLWLFEMQKYTDGTSAAILAFGFPALIIGMLLLIPLTGGRFLIHKRTAVAVVFCFGIAVVASLTALALYQDASDPRIAEQLAAQEKDEAEFRAKAFKPKTIVLGKSAEKNEPEQTIQSLTAPISAFTAESIAVPKSYITNCAKCHGANGEGTTKFPELTGVTTREEDRLTDESLLEIINDPKSYGLSSKMPAFRDKLGEEEKREIIQWIRSLK